jgi:gas vesicle protein
MRNNINHTKSILIGLLLGSMAGAAGMLLFTPQSGKRTRSEIQIKSIQLRDRTNDIVNRELAELRLDTQKFAADVQEKAGQLKHLGQEKLVEKMDQVSSVLDAGIIAIEKA